VNAVGPPPAAANIPTLSQWAMAVLIVMLAGVGLVRARRTRH